MLGKGEKGPIFCYLPSPRTGRRSFPEIKTANHPPIQTATFVKGDKSGNWHSLCIIAIRANTGVLMENKDGSINLNVTAIAL